MAKFTEGTSVIPDTPAGDILARLEKAEARMDYLERALKAFVSEVELAHGKVDRSRIFPERTRGDWR